MICIVTDAELPADAPKAATAVCDGCSVCADLCPMHALGGETVAIDVGGVRYDLVAITNGLEVFEVVGRRVAP